MVRVRLLRPHYFIPSRLASRMPDLNQETMGGTMLGTTFKNLRFQKAAELHRASVLRI